MKLLLRTESGEVVQFDVLPDDTFADLSKRLVEHGKVSVNLSQLSSKGRPIDMDANVMEYFNIRTKARSCEQPETLSDSANDQSEVDKDNDGNVTHKNVDITDGNVKDANRTDSSEDDMFGISPPEVQIHNSEGYTISDLSRHLVEHGKVSVSLSQLIDRPVDKCADVVELLNAGATTSSDKPVVKGPDVVEVFNKGATTSDVHDNKTNSTDDEDIFISPPEVELYNAQGILQVDKLLPKADTPTSNGATTSSDIPVDKGADVVEGATTSDVHDNKTNSTDDEDLFISSPEVELHNAQGATTSSDIPVDKGADVELFNEGATTSDVHGNKTNTTNDEDLFIPSPEVELHNAQDPPSCKLVCRLCAQPIQPGLTVKYIYDDDPWNEECTLADKINLFLPVSVSKEDDLPKQICSCCLICLEANYKFAKLVTKAEEILINKQVPTSPVEDDGCPLCEGHMRCDSIENEVVEVVAPTKTIEHTVKEKPKPNATVLVQRNIKGTVDYTKCVEAQYVPKGKDKKDGGYYEVKLDAIESSNIKKPVMPKKVINSQQKSSEAIKRSNIAKEIERRRESPKKDYLQQSPKVYSNNEPLTDDVEPAVTKEVIIEEVLLDSSFTEEVLDSLITIEELERRIGDDTPSEVDSHEPTQKKKRVSPKKIEELLYAGKVAGRNPLQTILQKPFSNKTGKPLQRRKPFASKIGKRGSWKKVAKKPCETFRRNTVPQPLASILDSTSEKEVFEVEVEADGTTEETAHQQSPKRKRGRSKRTEEVVESSGAEDVIIVIEPPKKRQYEPLLSKPDSKISSWGKGKKPRPTLRSNNKPRPSTSDSSSIQEVFDSSNDTVVFDNQSIDVETVADEPPKKIANVPKKRGRPRKVNKKPNYEKDKDWSAKDELITVKRRGRPRGSKNKTSESNYTEVDCRICDAPFPDVPELLSHTLLVHCEDGSDALACPLCDTFWPDEGELVLHVNSHSTSYKVIISNCMFCPKAFKVRKELQHHLFDDHIAHKPSSHNCCLCDDTFSTTMLLAVHLADTDAHSFDPENNRWDCPKCNYRFSAREEFMHHFLTTHPPGSEVSYDCPKCEQNIVSDTAFVQHMMRFHCDQSVIERPLFYKCPACGSKYKSLLNLIRHACSGIGFEWYCEECKIRYPIKARYILHLQFHNEKQYFEMRCDICLAEFTEEDSFYDHIRFDHEPTEKQNCPLCNKVFNSTNTLTSHMRKHEEPRKHKCEVCEKTFLNAQTLREHSIMHMKVKPYRCHICGQTLSRPSRLRAHIRSHSVHMTDNIMTCYRCLKCSRVFPNSDLAKQHCEIKHKKSPKPTFKSFIAKKLLKCEFCDACYETHNSVKRHRVRAHANPDSDEAFICSVCLRRFSTFARLATHKLTHGITLKSLTLRKQGQSSSKPTEFTIPQYFICENCNKECLHYTYLQMHRKICNPEPSQVHPCKDCGETFPSAYAAQYHRRKIHNSKITVPNKSSKNDGDLDLYECPICLRNYASPETLDLHMKRIHPHSSKQHAGYVCETCGKTFAYKGAWKSHCDAHSGIKRFHCNECDKRFTHKAGLKKHMKLHSDQPHVCDFCPQKFRDKTERANHMRAHTGERPYMCDICGNRFHTRAVWLDHSKIHQDIRPHHCDKCGQCFRRSFALKSHLLIHTGERPFACSKCDKTFRLKQSLLTHTKKEHGPKPTRIQPPRVQKQHGVQQTHVQEEHDVQQTHDQEEVILPTATVNSQQSIQSSSGSQVIIVDGMEYELPTATVTSQQSSQSSSGKSSDELIVVDDMEDELPTASVTPQQSSQSSSGKSSGELIVVDDMEYELPTATVTSQQSSQSSSGKSSGELIVVDDMEDELPTATVTLQQPSSGKSSGQLIVVDDMEYELTTATVTSQQSSQSSSGSQLIIVDDMEYELTTAPVTSQQCSQSSSGKSSGQLIVVDDMEYELPTATVTSQQSSQSSSSKSSARLLIVDGVEYELTTGTVTSQQSSQSGRSGIVDDVEYEVATATLISQHSNQSSSSKSSGRLIVVEDVEYELPPDAVTSQQSNQSSSSKSSSRFVIIDDIEYELPTDTVTSQQSSQSSSPKSSGPLVIVDDIEYELPTATVTSQQSSQSSSSKSSSRLVIADDMEYELPTATVTSQQSSQSSSSKSSGRLVIVDDMEYEPPTNTVTSQQSSQSSSGSQLIIVDDVEYELPDEIPDLEIPNDVEGTESVLSENNETQVISFPNFDLVISKERGEDNDPTKSDLVSTEEVVNHDDDPDKDLLPKDKPFSILAIKKAKMPIHYNNNKTFQKTITIPIIYYKPPPDEPAPDENLADEPALNEDLPYEPAPHENLAEEPALNEDLADELSPNEDLADERASNEDLPILDDLCQMMDEPSDSK